MTYTESMLDTEWIPSARIANGADVTLDVVRCALQHQCEENGIPIAFKKEQLKIGGMLSRQYEEMLVAYHPEHASDYLNFGIRVKHTGRYAFVNVYSLGGSKNYRNENAAHSDSDWSILYSIANRLGGHRTKMEAEEQYYAILQDCFSNIFV